MRSAETIANRAGTAGLLLYCLGIMSWEDMLVGGQWLMVIAMALVIPRIYRSLLRDRLFQLSLLFYIYLLLHAGVLLYKDPALGGRILQDVPAYFRMGFFQALMIGFWWAAMAEQRRLSWPLWALISGYCLRILLDWPNEDWSQGIPAKLGFGLYYTLFGAFSALVATWMVVQLIRAADTQRTLAANFGLSVLGVISLLGLAYSSSRGAVLGFLCAFPLILYQWWRGSSRTVARWKPAAAGVAAMLILAIVIAGGPITERDPGGGRRNGAASRARARRL